LYFDGDYNYAYSRVSNCYVWHKNLKKLVYVRGASNANTKLRVVLSSGVEDEAKWSDIDFATPPVGGFNAGIQSFFVERAPLRRDWRQGLRYSQFRVYPNTSDDWLTKNWSSIEKAMNQEFPKLDQAIFEVEDYAESRALSFCFFIEKDFSLSYKKSLTVGKVGHDDRLLLLQNYSWMKEQLGTVVGENNVAIQYS